jgi:hypothetical protein
MPAIYSMLSIGGMDTSGLADVGIRPSAILVGRSRAPAGAVFV